MSTKSLEQIKKEMQARLTELKPLVEEAQEIEAILGEVKARPRLTDVRVPAAATRAARSVGRRRAGRPITSFRSFEHRVNSYYKRMREDLPEYFTLGLFSKGASFDHRNKEAMAAFDYLVQNGFIERYEVEDVSEEARPHGWWMANCLYRVVDPTRKTNFKKEEAAIA